MYVTLEAFKATITSLLALLERRAGFLLVTSATIRPPVYFDLRTDDPHANALLEDSDALYDVTDALSAIVVGADEERFVHVRTGKTDRDDTEPADVAREKFRLVLEAFPVDELEKRYSVKTNAKTRTLAYSDWEVVVKIANEAASSSPNPRDPMPYALWKITGEGRRYDENRRDLVLTIDIQDVEFLLASLTRLRDTLLPLDQGENE